MPLKTAKKILRKNFICNQCLGRQFANLLTGFSNQERGKAIRNTLAMEYEEKPFRINPENLHDYRFKDRRIRTAKPGKCFLCEGIFEKLPKFSEKTAKKIRHLDFQSFVAGNKTPDKLLVREEDLWDDFNIRYFESIKTDINREFGKILEKKLKKKADKDSPDVVFLLDIKNEDVEIRINPLFVYGKYKKLIRGIPQTKWEKYSETVEDIIAKPFMKAAKGLSHSMHAAGREDIDARCLDWRPFVFEVTQPKKRSLDFKKNYSSCKQNQEGLC